MARHKIDYGIDLGTTNSAIARCDDGIIKIIKSSMYQKDTTPSCVHISKKHQIQTGDLAHTKLYRLEDNSRTFIEFKGTMGLDTLYPVEINDYNLDIEKRLKSEELSAEVLKSLKNYVTDDTVKSVVVTIPARFERVQIDATIRSTKLAGFEYSEILLEPIAASTAFAVESKFTDGYWLVYDFGGGTFDVALMCSIDGIMKVIGTAGDTHLGGKDFDERIVDKIILKNIKTDYTINNLLSSKRKNPFLTSLKCYAETTKIKLSTQESYMLNDTEEIIELQFKDDNGKDIQIDCEIKKVQYEDLIKPLIQRSIDLSIELLKNNNIMSEDLKTVLMVGGTTYTPILRKMVKEQITDKINISIDPMTVVAKGAAIYASTRDIPLINQDRDLTKIQLNPTYPSTSVEKDILFSYLIMDYNTEFNKYTIQMIRIDEGFDSGKHKINNSSGFIELELSEHKHNLFDIIINDEYGNILVCEPNRISIYHGTTIAPQVTAHDYGIGIETTDDEGKIVLMFEKIIEKNTSLPTVGKAKFKIKKEVRPGTIEDYIWIPILEGEHSTKLIRNNLALEYYKYGNNEKISRLLPTGTEVEIEMKIDATNNINLSMYIPLLDETFEFDKENEAPEVDLKLAKVTFDDIVNNELVEANDRIDNLLTQSFSSYYKLGSTNTNNLKKEANEINELANSHRTDDNKKIQIRNRVNELQKMLDEIDNRIRHLIMGDNITQALNHAKQLQDRYGDNETQKELEALNKQYDDFISNKDTKFGKQVLTNIYSFNFKILNERIEYWVNEVLDVDKYFNTISWKPGTQNQAKQVLLNAKSIIASGPTTDSLRSIMIKLWDLMEDGANKGHNETGALTK